MHQRFVFLTVEEAHVPRFQAFLLAPIRGVRRGAFPMTVHQAVELDALIVHTLLLVLHRGPGDIARQDEIVQGQRGADRAAAQLIELRLLQILPGRVGVVLEREEDLRIASCQRVGFAGNNGCLLYTSPSPRARTRYRIPSSP